VAGDSLVLTATGKINFGRDKGFSGPRGIPEDFRFYNQVQGANFGALLLRTGYADWVVAGDGGSYIAPESGKLQLLVNDRVSADNSGSFKVTVKIYPRNDL
jgi:hypothetical protein